MAANTIEELTDGSEYEEEYDEVIDDGEEFEEVDDQYEEQVDDASSESAEEPAAARWAAFDSWPEATRTAVESRIEDLKASGRHEMSILLLGLAGVGKSSTTNSLLGEQVATVTALASQPFKPDACVRCIDGFHITVIDTPGLLTADSINHEAFEAIGSLIRELDVDVLIYLDRLDGYRVGPEQKAVLAEISNTFGADIWKRAVLGLTRGGMQSPPPGTTLETYIAHRVETLQKGIRSAAGTDAPLPAALIENRSACKINESGEKVLADGTPWISSLFSQCVDTTVRQAAPLQFDPQTVKRTSPNRKRMWLMPLILAAQVALKVFVLDRVIEEDGYRQDVYGPYDKEYAAEERRRGREEKAARSRRRESSKKKASAGRTAEKGAREDFKGFAPGGNTFTPAAEDLEDDMDDDFDDDDY